jgi:hypothetical protein
MQLTYELRSLKFTLYFHPALVVIFMATSLSLR